jgi:glycosyltransferase involved in cell wall biosynthesis
MACDFHLRYATMLARGLSEAGAEVALLTRDHDEEFDGLEGAASDFIERAGPVGGKRFVVPGRVRSPRGLAAAARVRRQVRRFGADVVHLQESIGNDARLIFASGARRRRFAFSVHDPVRHPGESFSGMAERGNQLLTRTAGLLFVHANALRDELEAVSRPRAPIVVVPHGVEGGDDRPLPEQPSILFFGRLGYYKGIDVLLDAMGTVWESIPEATLTIAGSGELDEHAALADSRVTLRHEHVPEAELPALFGAARCVALPYRQASQSGVGSVAKRYARPMVVSDVGGLPELVEDGSGLLAPAEDPAALAESLVAVLRDEGVAERLSAAARRTAVSGADWRTVGELTLQAYQEHLLSGGRGG